MSSCDVLLCCTSVLFYGPPTPALRAPPPVGGHRNAVLFYCVVVWTHTPWRKNCCTAFTVYVQNRFSTIRWELLCYYRAIAELLQARYRAVRMWVERTK